jgi:hypothetical protein
MEEATRKSKGVVTNKNGLGVEFRSKYFKVQLSKIEVVVHVNKMACP